MLYKTSLLSAVRNLHRAHLDIGDVDFEGPELSQRSISSTTPMLMHHIVSSGSLVLDELDSAV